MQPCLFRQKQTLILCCCSNSSADIENSARVKVQQLCGDSHTINSSDWVGMCPRHLECNNSR